MRRVRLPVLILLTIAAAACGSDESGSSATSPATVPPSIATTTTAPPITTAAPTTVAAGPQPCAAGALTLTAGATEGAMGSAYTPLLLTNTAAVDCTLSTHIVLSFLDAGGEALGESVATPEAAGPGLVTVAPTESRQTVFRYSQPGNFPCDAYPDPSTLQLVVNQTEVLTLAPMDWPICPDRLPDQVNLLDLEAPT